MKTTIVILIGSFLPNVMWGQEHKMFHVTEVKQYQTGPECAPAGTATVCTVERWRVKGHTDIVEYEIACWELTQTNKEGTIISNVNCYPMEVGAEIEVQVFPSAIAYPPLAAGKDAPDYAWYMVQSARERYTYK